MVETTFSCSFAFGIGERNGGQLIDRLLVARCGFRRCRCKEAFDLLTSHQKMADELKFRKLFRRRQPPDRLRLLQSIEKSLLGDQRERAKANAPPRPATPPTPPTPPPPPPPPVRAVESNAVRIYVPFADADVRSDPFQVRVQYFALFYLKRNQNNMNVSRCFRFPSFSFFL